jgi:ABC-2 type transport system ATP-binding protein
VLDHGRIVAQGSADELKQRIPGGHVQLEFADSEALELAGAFLEGATDEGGKLVLRVPNDGSVSSLRRLLAELEERQIEVERLSMHTPDLDDVFFAVTGHQTTEEVPAR